MTATRYRKRPVVIEAMHFRPGLTAPEAMEIYDWVERSTLGSFEPMDVIEGRKPYPASGVSIDPRDGRMIISTLEGLHWVSLGDWVIRGVQGEFYPCKPDVFAETYKPAEGQPDCLHTLEEIQNLPELTVLVDRHGYAWQWRDGDLWQVDGRAASDDLELAEDGPLTVVHTPGGSTQAGLRADLDRARQRIAELESGQPVTNETSDGYHTFGELYRFRMLYNAATFNAWAAAGLYDVHKSWRHSDGEECFGGGWFVVYASLPTGQISNHYPMSDWDLFQVPERERATEWDGHTPEDVTYRLAALLKSPPAHRIAEREAAR